MICDDVNDGMCVLHILTKIYQPIFVWGMSNQYDMVNICLWQKHTSTFNNLYFVWMCLPNASMYLLFPNFLILPNSISIDQSKDMSNMTYF